MAEVSTGKDASRATRDADETPAPARAPDRPEPVEIEAEGAAAPNSPRRGFAFPEGLLSVPQTLERAATAVFVLSALAIVVAIALFTALGVQPYQTLRSAEILLSLAATALVVAFVARSQSAMVLTFGVILIGALIVPTADIIRFALVVSGSEMHMTDFFVSAESGKSQRNRHDDVAGQILQSLERDNLPLAYPELREAAASVIASVLYREQRLAMLDQVRQRGSLEVLQAVREGKHRDWIYRYGQDEKFREDLRFLRTEGLISYAYEDFDTIVMTQYGSDVLTLSEPAQLARADGSSATFSRSPYQCPDDATPWQPDGTRREVELGSAEEFVTFYVEDGAEGAYTMLLEAPEQAVDPYMTLLSEDCNLIDNDDDSAGSLNASLVTTLQPGRYFLAIESINEQGAGALTIGKAASRQESRSTN